MTWSEQVHGSRTKSSLQRARAEYRQKRRGNSVSLGPDADFPSLLVLVGAVSGAVFCRREARKAKLQDWKQWPVVRQVLALVSSQRQPKAAGAQRHATAKIRPVAKPQRPSPAAAAAAAAMARTNNSPSPTMLQQRQMSNATTSTSGTSGTNRTSRGGSGGGSGGGAKKKGKKKKK